MTYHTIDLNTYARKEHFKYFMSMDHPFISVTVQVDITDWFKKIQEKNQPFFLSFLYHVAHALNDVPELRQRIKNDGIIEYERCGSSYTVSHPDGTYRYCNVQTDMPYEAFLLKAKIAQEQVLLKDLEEDEDPESYFFISTVPWINYTSVDMPTPNPRFSVPNIIWGKYEISQSAYEENNSVKLKETVHIPLTIMVNHAIVDGIHIAKFFEILKKRLSE